MKAMPRSKALLELDHSCCQFLVGNVLANDSNHKAVEAFKGMAFHVSDVQAKRELVNVAVKMLRVQPTRHARGAAA